MKDHSVCLKTLLLINELKQQCFAQAHAFYFVPKGLIPHVMSPATQTTDTSADKVVEPRSETLIYCNTRR